MSANLAVMRSLKVLIVVAWIAGSASAQDKLRSAHDKKLYELARTDIRAFAHEVSRSAKSDVGRAQAIVHWLTDHFEWKATDYRKRTVQEIIERRGGNCNDLAQVALAAMKELNIPLRRVHEVHIRTVSPDRGVRARALVKEKGKTLSVFGTHHNDHIWLEVYDSGTKQWFPADPWSGLVGIDEWMNARVGFGKRSGPNPDAPDMIVPIAIFAADAEGKFTLDRTRHYLVDEFARLYGGTLHTLPEWKEWTALLDGIGDKVAGAFAGTTDLHEYEPEIDSLATAYERLRSAYLKSPRALGNHRNRKNS